MKSLIISVISLGILVIGWSIFVDYADKNLHQLMSKIEDEITVSVYNEDWDNAEKSFKELSKSWHDQKKIYSLFLDSAAINETDYSIARVKAYIKAKDISLSAGELSNIKEQLGFLHLNETISVDNVL